MTRRNQEVNLIDIQCWALAQGHKVSPNAACVLFALLTFMSLDTHQCWPKRATIAQRVYDTDEPTAAQITVVSRCLTALVRAGLITRETVTDQGKIVSNLYRINVGAVGTWSTHGEGTRSTHGSGTRSTRGSGTRSTRQKYPLKSPLKSPAEHAGAKRHLKAVD